MTAEPENSVRKIGYARVSTADQCLDMQVEALKKYGVPSELIFTDKASRGTNDRPGFVRALKSAQHEGSEFVVWKLDRLGRTLTGILQVMELLHGRGISFVSLTERIDTKGPMGKAMIRLMAIFAELERDLIRERTLTGMQRAKERGDAHGRPRAMTEERDAKADTLLAAGERGNAVWKVVRAMPGPNLSRSAFYAWQKEWDGLRGAVDLEAHPE